MTTIGDLLDAAHQASIRYALSIHERHVEPTREAKAALREFHRPLPDEPAEPMEVFARLDRIGSPATMATTGGRFFGYVVGGALPVTIAASQLASVWDQNAGSWRLSPVSAELEEVTAGWILELLDLPRDSTVGFVTGSTMGTFSAVATARNALLHRQGWNVKTQGLSGSPPLRIVASEECH
ncbi:MAG: aspartate aminotransferase family protein, partial [Myxococcota bacterium]